MKFTPNVEITPEIIESIKNTDIKEFKKTDAYKKYCLPAEKRRVQAANQKRRLWWKNNWISIINLVIAVITLISTIAFGLLQMLK